MHASILHTVLLHVFVYSIVLKKINRRSWKKSLCLLLYSKNLRIGASHVWVFWSVELRYFSQAYFLSLGGKTNFIMNILPTFICTLYCMYTYTGHAGLGR